MRGSISGDLLKQLVVPDLHKLWDPQFGS